MGLLLPEYRSLIDLSPPSRPEPFRTREEMEEACDLLLKFLLRERGTIAAFSATYQRKRELVRGYMNERLTLPIPQDILDLQDRLFWTESLERGIVHAEEIGESKYGIALWQGDITRLDADGIVNAASPRLLGCFVAGHECVDNLIHSRAGMQLRRDCGRIMAQQGHQEESGDAKITRAYNLPCAYVIHTVAPMVGRSVTREQEGALRSCYISCLDLAAEMGLRSVAFCCIGTGVFNFPGEHAAEIAVGAVTHWKLDHRETPIKVIFDAYLHKDYEIYENILKYL